MSSEAKVKSPISPNLIPSGRPATPTGGTSAAGAVGTGEPTRIPPRLQDTFADERNDVLAVINELEDQLDRHQEIREALERELTGSTEKLQAANQRIQELEWQVVSLQTRVDSLEQVKQEIASLEEELADANARAQRLNEQFIAADKERVRLKSELKSASKQLDELWAVRKERDGLRTDCKNLSARVEELERTHREALEERGHLQSQMHELQMALDELRDERNRLDLAAREGQDRIRELTQVQESLIDKIEALRVEKKNLQAQLAHLDRENARLVEQRQFYESEVTSLRNQTRTAEAALANVKKAFTEVRVALSETKTRARRRTLDTWPRVGTALSGSPAAAVAGPKSAEIAAAIDDDPLGAQTTDDLPTAAEIGGYGGDADEMI